jgi:hypothetical protein
MTPETFFRKQVPEEWNRRLDEELARGGAGAERARKMQAISFGLEAEVTGAEGGRYALGVENGRMRPLDGPPADRLVRLSMSTADWRRLAEEIGPSPLALLGGIAGSRDFVLTGARLALLREVGGTFRLQVTGADEWGLTLHFGDGAPSEPPATEIAIGGEQYRQLREGALDLQGAFMTGQLQLRGNVEAAMKLALAFLAPE